MNLLAFLLAMTWVACLICVATTGMSDFIKRVMCTLVFAAMFGLMGAPKWAAIGLGLIMAYQFSISDKVRK